MNGALIEEILVPIIHYNDKYYVWYTRNTSTTSKWLDADIWYATSVDGNKWTEIGPAVKRGPEGSWDDWRYLPAIFLLPVISII